MKTLLVIGKNIPQVTTFCCSFSVGKRIWQQCHSVWDASGVLWQVFYKNNNTYLV